MKKFSLLSLILCIPLLSGCGWTTMSVYADADKYLIGNQVFETNAKSIDVDWLSGTLTLVEDNTITGAKLEETTSKLIDEEKVHSYYYAESGLLSVKYMASGYTSKHFISDDKNLTLTYNPTEIYKINVNLTSGKFSADSLTPSDKLEVKMTSGDCNLNKVLTKETIIEETSGRINIKEINSSKIQSKLTSGSLTIDKTDVGNFDLNQTSGDATIKFNSLTKGNIKATSGSISATLPTDGGKVNFSKTTGSLKVHREYNVINGQYVIGTGVALLDINITSGNVNIY